MDVYYVSFFLHNGKNDGWAYKVVNKYTDKDVAEKAFYSEYSQYIGGDTYDSVTLLYTDAYGNNVKPPLHWSKTVAEPEPDESEE